MIRLFRRGWRLFEPVLAGASLRDRLVACAGATLGLMLTALFCQAIIGPTLSPWLVAPVGASAVLLFAVPASPLAQPWPIVGGNAVSALVGVTVAGTIASLPVAAGVAVGGAILAMSLLRCLHPPGGAAALTAVLGGKSVMALGFWYPLLPVGMNSALLVLAGLIFHRHSGHIYPHRSIAGADRRPAPSASLDIEAGDIDRALQDLGETFDIGREDLELIFRQVNFHAKKRRALRN